MCIRDSSGLGLRRSFRLGIVTRSVRRIHVERVKQRFSYCAVFLFVFQRHFHAIARIGPLPETLAVRPSGSKPAYRMKYTIVSRRWERGAKANKALQHPKCGMQKRTSAVNSASHVTRGYLKLISCRTARALTACKVDER